LPGLSFSFFSAVQRRDEGKRDKSTSLSAKQKRKNRPKTKKPDHFGQAQYLLPNRKPHNTWFGYQSRFPTLSGHGSVNTAFKRYAARGSNAYYGSFFLLKNMYSPQIQID
jgi:hypothetical protein